MSWTIRRRLAIAAALAACTGSEVCAQDEQADQNRFDIWEYRVLGNSVLPAVRIEEVMYQRLGPAKTFDDVEAARAALEQVYRGAGYSTVFVDIPEQSVAQGIVRLQVTEGRLDRIRVTGAKYFSNRDIRSLAPSLKRGEVPYFPAVQADLNELNRMSRDMKVVPVLRAGRTPGTVDVELKIDDELPAHGSLEVNNRYTADTSETRASLNLSYDNLFQRQHSLSLQYQTAPQEPDEARVVAATYALPAWDTGHFASLYAVDTNSEVATVGTLSVLGNGRIYGARYTIPLPAHESYFHTLTLGGDFKDFDEDVLLTEEERLQTPIQYAGWSLSYGAQVPTEHTLNSFNVAANFGLRGLANAPEEFENKRFKAKANFFYLRANAMHERRWLFGTQLALRLAGQFTTEPLISNEQFGIGGADSVRGYLESAELGDLGIAGSLQWRTPSLGEWLGSRTAGLNAFVFVDAGSVAVIDALPGQASRVDLSSWGSGLRFAAWGLQADLDWAYPLNGTDNTERGDSRIHFRVSYGF